MPRRWFLLSCLLLSAGLSGCGGGETTDPDSLPPLSASDLEVIAARDVEVETEEKGTPKSP